MPREAACCWDEAQEELREALPIRDGAIWPRGSAAGEGKFLTHPYF